MTTSKRMMALGFSSLLIAVGCGPAAAPTRVASGSVTAKESPAEPIDSAAVVGLVGPVLEKAPHRAVGVAVLRDGKTWSRTFGPRSVDTGAPFDLDTVFEIGSVTKVLVGLLLGEAVARGEVTLSDAASAHVPGWKLPARDGTDITLLHLATHTSGLPMMPSNWAPMAHGATRADYSVAMFREFLVDYALPFRPGSAYAYGNVSTAVLSAALSARAATPFGALLDSRIFAPLGMAGSAYRDRPLRTANVLDGYDQEDRRKQRRVDTSPLGPCCAVSTTLRDMKTFMRSLLDRSSPIAEAFRLSVQPHFEQDRSVAVGLGWNINRRTGAIFKDGQVAGYRTMLVLVPAHQLGLFVVVNSEQVDVARLTWALLDRAVPNADRNAHSIAQFERAHSRFVVDELPSDVTPIQVDFGDSIRLVGYRAPSDAEAGDSVHVTFYYQCVRPLSADYRIFIHGDATAGDAKRIHGDHYPGADENSTLAWRAGDLIADEFTLEIPSDYRAPAFSIFSGWYRGRRRLPASSATTSVVNDKVRVVEIRVRR